MTTTHIGSPADATRTPPRPLPTDPNRREASRPDLTFARHLGEMAAAMLAGMVVLAPVWNVADTLAGYPGIFDRADVGISVMTVQMSIGMAVWMYHRRHPARHTLEMIAAMAVSGLTTLVPLWLGLVNETGATLLAHLLMVPAMAGAMLVRLDDYTRGVHRVDATNPSHLRTRLRPLADRWPTWLGLLLTCDQWTQGVVPPVLLAVLGAEYLIIGAARRSFPDRCILAWHVAGFVTFSAAAVYATTLSPAAAATVIGLGWLSHGVWDALLLHRNIVTWRWYAEACLAIDVIIGLSALSFAL